MAAQFKKFFLALVTVVLGAMSSGAMADTSYNFSYSGTNSYSITGVFGVDSSGVIKSISGTVSASNSYNGAIQFLMPPKTFAGNDNKYFSAGPYLSGDGVSFQTSGGTLNLYLDSGSTYKLYNNISIISSGSMTSSAAAAAVPEIDGALIPQVGLLLAGLFIILGRRKENTEAMLAV